MSAEQKPYPQLPSTKCALSTLCDVVDESRLWNKGQKCVHFESNPQAENLVKWFTENGGCVHPHVQLVHDDSRGFHVRATRTLDSPTAVVSCPLKLTLSHLNLDPNQTAVKHIDSPLQKCLQTIPSHVLANLLLIEQRALGEASPWFPYIACLPETFNTPLYFSVDDIKCLDGTNLIQAVSDRRELWIQEWTDAYTALEKAGLNDFPCDSLSYKWAATVMTSRAFISAGVFPDMPPFSILFPVVDSLNHAIQAKVDWEFEPLKLFTLKTLYDIYPGDEVLNNYAPKQNAELLMGYGFCIPDHPYEQFEVTVQVPAAIRPLLESSKIPFDMPACSIRNTDSNRQFFRMRDHPFGRYENLIPCLRGVPPLLVFVSYLIALHRRGISPEAVSVAHPGARIVVAVVQQIITGVKASFDRLTKNHPEHLPKTFENQNQKYANMYRIGQVKVVDAIHSELNEFMNTVAFDKGTVPPTRPVIITTTEALALLKEELPDHYDDFTERVSDALDVDLINMEEMSSGRYNFAGLDGIPENDCEDMIWILWLIVGYALTM
ncbi:SET domain-containing protein [Zopfia rhizophila CBS 207.26]|uniref:SET domain-containing protein n=1 Tax=Zopfia rhizophila CBS 207.26 TaxID=1314779 RepID=A0A6A6DK54_9PEZI|nr:SET domain-containing protein [Zopfia rhizophila CBS 207.26]